ncbi:MAG: hypothetical protein UY07_C0011G0013 [Parcubacteria group bacterium GW2011_GWA1_47_8]|nr:MAG: hypothetical protein UY07_C0011G0013 [Parcubacteria group bacterium GW2011_GWA1_47_8]
MEYEVIFEPFAERYFIKTFAKKYQGAWERTLKGLLLEFTFVDLLFNKSIAETIIDSEDIKICKTEFKIAGTQISRHASGDRCIIAVHKKAKKVCVLLVYHKNDLGGGNETANWKRVVRENYPAYARLL